MSAQWIFLALIMFVLFLSIHRLLLALIMLLIALFLAIFLQVKWMKYHGRTSYEKQLGCLGISLLVVLSTVAILAIQSLDQQRCRGSRAMCDDQAEEEACEKQEGCSWSSPRGLTTARNWMFGIMALICVAAVCICVKKKPLTIQAFCSNFTNKQCPTIICKESFCTKGSSST